MEVILKIKNKPQDGDILVFNKGAFESVDKRVFLKYQNEQITSLKNELEETKTKLKLVDAKLKEYHDVLQIISKGEK